VKPALVVSGGGSKGAFAVGAIRYLRETKGVEFGLVAGTSTGALIAPLVVTDEMALLEQLYTSVRNADLLAPVSVQTTWKRGYVFDTKPMEKLLAKTIDATRARRVLESAVPAFLSAVNLQTGRLTYFQAGGADGCSEGPHADLVRVKDRPTLLSAIVASTNQPLFMPAVCLAPKERPVREYVDGGVREYAPIHIAIANGASEVYAILHSPPPAGKSVREGQLKGLPAIAGRALQLLTDEIGESDLGKALLYSEATSYLETIRDNARGLGLDAEQITQLFAGENPFVGRRPVKIHVIRPERELPCSGLDFEPKAMKALVTWGARRAQEIVG
jgi:NTE family protein